MTKTLNLIKVQSENIKITLIQDMSTFYDNIGHVMFLVAGDFDIPSSREDVDRDSSWNQWLRSEIPQLFVHAMDVFSVRTQWNMMFLH